MTSNEGKSKEEKGKSDKISLKGNWRMNETARENRRRVSDERRRTEREAAKQKRRRLQEDEREGEGQCPSSNLSLLFAEVSLL